MQSWDHAISEEKQKSERELLIQQQRWGGTPLQQVVVRIRRLRIQLLGESVELVLLNVVDDRVRQQIFDALTPSDKEPDLARGNVVEDCLFDHLEVLAITPEQVVAQEKGPDIGPGPLDDHATVLAQNVMELYAACALAKDREAGAKRDTHIGIGPHAWLAHALDQISTSEEHDANLSPAAVGDEDAALRAPVDDLVKVVQDHGRALVLVLERLPGIHHEPRRCLLDGQSVVQLVRMGKTAWAGETINSLAHAHAVRRLC